MITSTQFQTDIQTALGGNLIDVELSSTDYDYAFDKAKRIFQQRGNNNYDRKFVKFDTVVEQLDYTIDPSENVDSVIRIIKPKSNGNSSDPFYSSFIQNFWGGGSALSNGLADYEQYKQSIKTYEKYLLHETQYVWKKRLNVLSLLNQPRIAETWMIECYADLSDVEYEDVFWVREYSIAECKILLGNAYRKFQNLASPSGDTSLSGDAMIQEGKEEQNILLENISDYVDGDITGSVFIMG